MFDWFIQHGADPKLAYGKNQSPIDALCEVTRLRPRSYGCPRATPLSNPTPTSANPPLPTMSHSLLPLVLHVTLSWVGAAAFFSAPATTCWRTGSTTLPSFWCLGYNAGQISSFCPVPPLVFAPLSPCHNMPCDLHYAAQWFGLIGALSGGVASVLHRCCVEFGASGRLHRQDLSGDLGRGRTPDNRAVCGFLGLVRARFVPLRPCNAKCASYLFASPFALRMHHAVIRMPCAVRFLGLFC